MKNLKSIISLFVATFIGGSTIHADGVYQIPNGNADMEWPADNEPGNGLHSFKNASLGSSSLLLKTGKSSAQDLCYKETGRTGNAVAIKSKSVAGIAKANGNLTTGNIVMGSTTPANKLNHNETNRSMGADGSLEFIGLPDSIEFYTKYKKGENGDYNGNALVIVHGDCDYADPIQEKGDIYTKEDYVVADAQITITPSTDWTRFVSSLVYYTPAKVDLENDKRYLLLNMTTNPTPGGSAGDVLIVDDIRFIYNSKLRTLTYDGVDLLDGNKDAFKLSVEGVYDESKLAYSVDGKGASAETVYDATNSILAITVKGNDISDDANNFHKYEIEFKSVVDTIVPVDPDTIVPVDPDTIIPVDPDTIVPVDPDTIVPVDPDTIIPVDPDTIIPVDPDTIIPVDPDTIVPVDPDTIVPVDPDTIIPVDPDTIVPVDPDTIVPVDPDTIIPVDPDTIVPVDPDTIIPVDPDTIVPVDPDTIVPVDPDTIVPVDPDTIVPVDPDTIVPVDPDTIIPVDPDTIIPVDPDTIVPVDPDTIVPVDPDTITPGGVVPKLLRTVVYTDDLVINISGDDMAPQTQDITVAYYDNGMATLSIMNFVMGEGEDGMLVGDIVLDSVPYVQTDSIRMQILKNIFITSSNPDALGNSLPEIPVEIKSAESSNSFDKLKAVIGIDLEDMYVTVNFGYSDKTNTGVVEEEKAPKLLRTVVYTDDLVINISGDDMAPQTQDITVAYYDNGMATLSIMNFVMGEGEDGMLVGDIVLDSVPYVQTDSIRMQILKNIFITSSNPDALGNSLPEIPVEIKSAESSNSFDKLKAVIGIDLEDMYVTVNFGYSDKTNTGVVEGDTFPTEIASAGTVVDNMTVSVNGESYGVRKGITRMAYSDGKLTLTLVDLAVDFGDGDIIVGDVTIELPAVVADSVLEFAGDDTVKIKADNEYEIGGQTDFARVKVTEGRSKLRLSKVFYDMEVELIDLGLTFDVSFGDSTTAVIDIPSVVERKEDTRVFTITGVYVGSDIENMNSLPAGIYIRDKKKFIIR